MTWLARYLWALVMLDPRHARVYADMRAEGYIDTVHGFVRPIAGQQQ